MSPILCPTDARGDRNFAAHKAILRGMLENIPTILRNMVTATRLRRMTPIKDVDKMYMDVYTGLDGPQKYGCGNSLLQWKVDTCTEVNVAPGIGCIGIICCEQRTIASIWC